MLTEERLKQIARKLTTYAAIYTGDKEAREMARDCERAASVGANVGAETVLVPREPTEAMVQAAWGNIASAAAIHRIWSDMIQASPPVGADAGAETEAAKITRQYEDVGPQD